MTQPCRLWKKEKTLAKPQEFQRHTTRSLTMVMTRARAKIDLAMYFGFDQGSLPRASPKAQMFSNASLDQET